MNRAVLPAAPVSSHVRRLGACDVQAREPVLGADGDPKVTVSGAVMVNVYRSASASTLTDRPREPAEPTG
jgi:hypothetical protein